jgi:hypothetical protein
MRAPLWIWIAATLAALPARGFGAVPSAAPEDSIRLGGKLVVRGGHLLSSGEVRARLRGAGGAALGARETQQALASLGEKLIEAGYLEAEIRLEPTGNGGAVLYVDEGRRASWDSLIVRLAPAAESLAVLRPGSLARPRRGGVALPVPSGRADPAQLEALLWNWVDLWTEHGHPFAQATVDSITVDPGGIRAALRLDPGPELAVSAVSFPGRTGTREAFLRRWIRFRPGDPYRESQWDARRRRLEQSGLFVRVDDPALVPASDGLHVVLPVEEGRHNHLEGAIGYSGGSRTVSGFGDLELGNLFGTGRVLGVRWERLQKNQSRIRVAYREPLIGPLPVGAHVSVEQEIQDSTYTLVVGEAVAEAMVGWDMTAFAGGEYRRSVIGPEPSELTRRLSSLIGGRWDTMRPGRYRGGRLEASFRAGTSRVRPAGEEASRRLRLNRASFEVERFWPLGQTLILRGHATGSALSRSDSLSITEALRIGGAGSVRGYGEEEFATLRYLAGQAEVGLSLPQGRAYVFADAAWFRRFAFPRNNSDAVGYGVGLSSETAQRRLTVDLGLPRGGTLREGRLHVRLETRF